MAGYVESHELNLKKWVAGRNARRGTAEPEHRASTQALGLATATGHRLSSLTWDDVDQRYTMLGPMTPVYPATMGYTDTDLDRLLRASAWSWASINGNAKAMSQLTPIAQEKVGGRWVKMQDASHPLQDFIRDPLGKSETFPFWSWQHLLYVTALHYYAAGNAYQVPVCSLAGLSVVPLLSPISMSADVDELYGAPTLYRYKRGGGKPDLTWKPDQLLNIMAPSPSSFWKGASPLRAALRSTEIDHIATERQRYNLRNRVSPGIVVGFDAPLSPNPEQRAKIKAELEADHQRVQDDGGILVLGSGPKAIKGWSPEELQVFDTKNSARDEIIATIGTQPSILGQLDRATYSNTKEATVLWFTGSIAPVLEVIYGHYNAQLVHRQYGDDVRLFYSLAGSHIGLQLQLAALEVGEKLQGLGYSTNDINDHLELGMPERPYLDKSTGRDVIAGRAEPDEATDEDADQEADDEQDTQPPELAIVADD